MVSDFSDAEGLRLAQPAEVPAGFPRVAALPRARLLELLQAGREVLECQRVLKNANINLVSEVLCGQETFTEFNHYPDADVFDAETYSQYFYHAHRGTPDEHGHFHTFLRAGGMPKDIAQVEYHGDEQWPTGTEALAHLIAISMDAYGWPIALFATNRWVTAECWHPAEDVIHMLDQFQIDHAYPSWPVNRWITSMLRLFRPQIEALLRHRDQVVEMWQKDNPTTDVYEDRALEVTGYLPISVEAQLSQVEHLLSNNAKPIRGGVRSP